jgi:hypothetical protein
MSKLPKFGTYVCDGDKITWMKDGYEITAFIVHDDCGDKPDQRDDGFWPSLNPKAAGYIGRRSKKTLAKHMARAQAVMDAWLKDEWWYVGVCVTVSFDGVPLTGDYDHALWSVECNYPQRDMRRRNPNAYLTEVARELAGEALEAAKTKLADLARKHYLQEA